MSVPLGSEEDLSLGNLTLGELWAQLTSRGLLQRLLAAVIPMAEALPGIDARLDGVVASINRMEIALSAATEYVSAALDSLDVQMTDLKTRLTEDAAALQAALQQATLAQADEQALVAAADRIQATAVVVSQLAQPTAVADPGTGDNAGPLPGDGGGDNPAPEPAPAPDPAPVAPADGGGDNPAA